MQRQIGSTIKLIKKDYLTTLAVSILALILRLYHLGNSSLWFDEIGVAIATRLSSFPLLIESIRAHVMAMPLDYVIGWLFTQSCQSEACLRLPAALFGTLTIGVSYILFRQFVEYRIAAVGAIILAVSPFHIQYSQELRFYSALVFFYTLSTFLLIQAFEHPSFWRWAAFTLSITVGSYFHLYVYLALINGFVWAFLSRHEFARQKIGRGLQAPQDDSDDRIKKAIPAGFLGSFLVSSILILPGYLYFKA